MSNSYANLNHVQLFPYTKFKASFQNPIIQHLNHQRGILALSSNSVNFNNRRGVCQFSLNQDSFQLPSSNQNTDQFKKLSCMTLNSNTNNDLIIGGENSLVKLNLLKPNVLQSLNHPGNLSFINSLSKFLTLGTSNGTVEIFDPTSETVMKSFYGHNGLLSDLDVQGNYVATCGYSLRPRRNNNNNHHINSPSLQQLKTNKTSMNDYMVDPLVNIYDLRMMRSLPPIPFPAGASFVRFHPKLPNIIIISSITGQLQFVDIYDQLNVYLYQANLSQPHQLTSASLSVPALTYLSNLDISENGEYLCFNDGYLNLHLWSTMNNTNKNFINFPNSLDQPDIMIQPPSVSPMKVDDQSIPLSTIGMPYYKDFLLSNYGSDLVFEKELLKLPTKIDPTLCELSESYNSLQQSNKLLSRFIAYDKTRLGNGNSRNTYNKYENLKNSKLTNAGKKSTTSSLLPKFLSERERVPTLSTINNSNAHINTLSNNTQGDQATPPQSHESNDQESLVKQQLDGIFQFKLDQPNTKNKIPNCYSKLQIHYSKFGVGDFDFNYYNKSLEYSSDFDTFCGLENHVDNSYINSIIQLYRFSPIIFNSITKSVLVEWLPNDTNSIINMNNPQGSSILNELGYLFDMMFKSNGESVKISNFSQVLNNNQFAKLEKILDFDDTKNLNGFELQSLVIKFNKFLIETIINDQKSQLDSLNETERIDSIFNIVYELEVRSNGCEFYDKQLINQLSLDLITPPQYVLNKLGNGITDAGGMNNVNNYNPSMTFNKKNHNILTYLEYSLNQTKSLPCNNNHIRETYPHLVEFKQTLIQLPPVLSINLPFKNQEFQLIKSFKKWLVPEFYTVKNTINKKINFKPVVTQFNQEASKYELLGYVCKINHDLDSVKGENNLLSFIKIKLSNSKDQWFLFNDFLVMPIPEDEVFNLNYNWKNPLLLIYHNVDNIQNQEFDYFTQSFFSKLKVNDSILYRDHFACGIREGYKQEYTLLSQNSEAPRPGTLIAIDAEFVTLQPEELEVSYDGTKNLIKPKVLSLARISVIRGENNDSQGKPLIDDYIIHTQPIYDYLTNFSGIEPGDLDPIDSSKNLVTLQTAYRRLWLLLNLGCVFVGHGLKNDFRTINLKVPSQQIRDTIDYYYLPDFKRRLSLKFLAFVLLKEKVQIGNHDSIEDAYTALLLYKRYIELNAIGEFESTLDRIYMEGQQLRFRVPDA